MCLATPDYVQLIKAHACKMKMINVNECENIVWMFLNSKSLVFCVINQTFCTLELSLYGSSGLMFCDVVFCILCCLAFTHTQ